MSASSYLSNSVFKRSYQKLSAVLCVHYALSLHSEELRYKERGLLCMFVCAN